MHRERGEEFHGDEEFEEGAAATEEEEERERQEEEAEVERLFLAQYGDKDYPHHAYQLLGLPKDASLKDIEKQHQRLFLCLHEDHSKAAKKFLEDVKPVRKQIQKALEVLKDPEARSQHDAFIYESRRLTLSVPLLRDLIEQNEELAHRNQELEAMAGDAGDYQRMAESLQIDYENLKDQMAIIEHEKIQAQRELGRRAKGFWLILLDTFANAGGKLLAWARENSENLVPASLMIGGFAGALVILSWVVV